MIFTDSRYATGRIFKAYDSRKDVYSTTVFRRYPYSSTKFTAYTWTERDRLDLVAEKFLGSSDMWWSIMDYNPEIIDPFAIPVGTVVRIPNG
jgi:hypothetical protein